MTSSMKRAPAADPTHGPTTSSVDTVFDTVLGGVDAGLGHVGDALSAGARTLLRTARTLDVVRERLRA